MFILYSSYYDQVDILNILRITILTFVLSLTKYIKMHIYYFNDNINIWEFVLHFTMIL